MTSVGATMKRTPSQAVDISFKLDGWLLFATLSLVVIGLVMVSSASITIADRNFDAPFHYFIRQLIFIGLGIAVGVVVSNISLEHWERYSPLLMVAGIALLILVLIPGIGTKVNGSYRWLSLGIINLQPSEVMKLCAILFMAGFLVRRAEEVRASFAGFAKPFMVLLLIAVLLMMEPDMGSTVVILATTVSMMFLAGVPLNRFAVVIGLGAMAVAAAILAAPYRLERVTSYLNPWADPFDSGFQLTQALIAFGRGEWFGVGLGSSIQKLFYLPEAHTDFVFSVLCEELGFIAGALVILLFGLLVWRAFRIGKLAMEVGQPFAGYLAFGIGIWIGMQAFINIGVNMGALPTKGLTLPLMSYGGSSILVTCTAIAFLFRVHHEALSATPVERRKVERK